MPELDIAGIVRALHAHGVRLPRDPRGGGPGPRPARPGDVDIDVTPARDPDNLRRLAAAFDDLDAGLLTADEAGTWFPRHPVENWSSYDTLHLMTRLGALDVVFVPDGAPRGYDELAPSAERHRVLADDATALVVSVGTWEHLKSATGRAKDLEHLDRFYGRPQPPVTSAGCAGRAGGWCR